MMKVIHIVVVLAMFYCGAVSAQTEAVPSQTEAVPSQTEAVPTQTEAVPTQTEAVPIQKKAVPIQTAYVTDKLQLGLHAAEDTSDAPMKNLVSGTALEILERNRFYARVRTPDGREGWVKAGYLTDEKPAAARILELEAASAAAKTRLDSVLAQTTDVRQTITDLERELAVSREKAEQATSRVAELESETGRFNQRMGDFRSSVPVRWALLAASLMLVIGAFAGFLWFDQRSRKRFGGFRVY